MCASSAYWDIRDRLYVTHARTVIRRGQADAYDVAAGVARARDELPNLSLCTKTHTSRVLPRFGATAIRITIQQDGSKRMQYPSSSASCWIFGKKRKRYCNMFCFSLWSTRPAPARSRHNQTAFAQPFCFLHSATNLFFRLTVRIVFVDFFYVCF